MMNKIKELFEKAMNLLPKVRAQDSMTVIIAYGILLAVISISFMGAWILNGWKSGKPDMDIMLRFFQAATGAGPVAAVTFLSIFFVDKNQDGRPDAAENKAEDRGRRI